MSDIDTYLNGRLIADPSAYMSVSAEIIVGSTVESHRTRHRAIGSADYDIIGDIKKSVVQLSRIVYLTVAHDSGGKITMVESLWRIGIIMRAEIWHTQSIVSIVGFGIDSCIIVESMPVVSNQLKCIITHRRFDILATKAVP